MGFDMNILVLRPEKYGSGKVWRSIRVLNVGRITSRLNDPGYAKKNARGRAALHFLECVFGDLNVYSRTMGRRCLAPHFTTENTDTLARLKGSRRLQLIVPFWSSMGQLIPDASTIHEHNKAVRLSNGHAEKDDIVFEYPLIWVPCRQVLEWIEKNEKTDMHARVKHDDYDALSLLEKWKSALVHSSKEGCNILFFFESIDDPLII